MYHKCQEIKCLWEVYRDKHIILCFFPYCIYNKLPDPDQEQTDPPGTEPDTPDSRPP